ncbi:mansc domain containing protein [Anaeramoeba flamelloides]|uniref:Mansc domain containing protein n=1 Tax=Anaeramoeba flamelloides TaxID=1746091 RepID=A0ABQ8YBS0_9EUKA|nr:mansc domain containing protein [Anaeramoeba flamelloides]
MDLFLQFTKTDRIPLFDELQDLFGIFIFKTYQSGEIHQFLIEDTCHLFLTQFQTYKRKQISRLLAIICQLFIQNEIFLFASTNKNNYQTYTLNSYWKPCFEKINGSQLNPPNEITHSIFSLNASQFQKNSILEQQFGYPKIEITETGVIYDGKRISPQIEDHDDKNKRKRRAPKKKKTRLNKTISMLTYMSIYELKNGVDSRETISVNSGFARQRICAALSVYKGLGLVVELKKRRGHLFLNRKLLNLLPDMKTANKKIIDHRKQRRSLILKGKKLFELLLQKIESNQVTIQNSEYLEKLKQRTQKLFSEKEIFYTGVGDSEDLLKDKTSLTKLHNFIGNKIQQNQVGNSKNYQQNIIKTQSKQNLKKNLEKQQQSEKNLKIRIEMPLQKKTQKDIQKKPTNNQYLKRKKRNKRTKKIIKINRINKNNNNNNNNNNNSNSNNNNNINNNNYNNKNNNNYNNNNNNGNTTATTKTTITTTNNNNTNLINEKKKSDQFQINNENQNQNYNLANNFNSSINKITSSNIINNSNGNNNNNNNILNNHNNNNNNIENNNDIINKKIKDEQYQINNNKKPTIINHFQPRNENTSSVLNIKLKLNQKKKSTKNPLNQTQFAEKFIQNFQKKKTKKTKETKDEIVAAEAILQLSPKPYRPRSPITSPLLNYYFPDLNSDFNFDNERNEMYSKGDKILSPLYSGQISSPLSFLQMSPPPFMYNMNSMNLMELNEKNNSMYVPPNPGENFYSSEEESSESSDIEEKKQPIDNNSTLYKTNNNNDNNNNIIKNNINNQEQNSEDENLK